MKSFSKSIGEVNMAGHSLTVYVNPVTKILYKPRKAYRQAIMNCAISRGISEAGFYTFNISETDDNEFMASLEDDYATDVKIFFKLSSTDEEIVSAISMFGLELNVDVPEFEKVLKDVRESDDELTLVYLDSSSTQFSEAGFTSADKKVRNAVHSIQRATSPDSNSMMDGQAVDYYFSEREMTYGFAVIDDDVPLSIGNDYFLNDELRTMWSTITAPLVGGSDLMRVFLYGLAGSGKSDFAEQLSASFGEDECDFAFIEPSMLQEPSDWFSRRGAKAGDTIDEPNNLAKLLQEDTDKPLIIMVDEVNRAPSTEFLNPLMQMLGEQKLIKIGQEYIRYTRPTLFVVTGNIGSEYAGTDLIDVALLSRFDVQISMKPASEKLLLKIANSKYAGEIDETVIKNMTKCVHEMISHFVDNNLELMITPRNLLNVLKVYKTCKSERASLTFSIISNPFLDDSLKAKLEEILMVHYPM